MQDEPIIAATKISEKGPVQIPLAARQKLDLKPGTRLIVIAAEEAANTTWKRTQATEAELRRIVGRKYSILHRGALIL